MCSLKLKLKENEKKKEDYLISPLLSLLIFIYRENMKGHIFIKGKLKEKSLRKKYQKTYLYEDSSS